MHSPELFAGIAGPVTKRFEINAGADKLADESGATVMGRLRSVD